MSIYVNDYKSIKKILGATKDNDIIDYIRSVNQRPLLINEADYIVDTVQFICKYRIDSVGIKYIDTSLYSKNVCKLLAYIVDQNYYTLYDQHKNVIPFDADSVDAMIGDIIDRINGIYKPTLFSRIFKR